MSPSPILSVRDLGISFQTERGLTSATRNVSFDVAKGESLAIVGESGSGKSITALSFTRLLPEPPAKYASGEILWKGRDVLKMKPNQLRSIRGGEIAYIFQEPSTSLNPVYTIRNQIAEAIRLHRPEVQDIDKEIVHWLDAVGIVNPAKRMHDYPHQLSGGMQQRCMIAMALSCHPDLLIADEPTTALDVTIQKQILDQLRELRSRLGMAIILITHNLAIIRGLCDNVAVMFRGDVVEFGPAEEILNSPKHPYTRALLDCIPKLGAHQERLRTIDYAQLE